MFTHKFKKQFAISVLLILVLFFSLRLPSLGTDISNSDAARWHRRSERFLTSLKNNQYKDTYQHYQPGVTIMWLDSLVNQLSFSHQVSKGEIPKTLENSTHYPFVHGYAKTLIIFVLASFLLIQLFLLRNLFSERIATLYGLFIAIEPFLIGIDRWFHLTSLETYSAFTAFLLLMHWYKSNNKKVLTLSAFILAFSVLSKLTTLIVVPVFLYIFILRLKEKPTYDVLIFAGVFIASFFTLFPSLWVEPLYVFNKLGSAIFKAVGNDIRSEIISPLLQPIYYLVILVFKLSPIVLVLFGLFITKFKVFSKQKEVRFVLLYLLCYFLFLTLAQQKIDRYSIAMFPSIILLASVYLDNLRERYIYIVSIISILFVGLMSYIHFPVFSGYYSPLFGCTEKALSLDIYDNSGEYYADAALYLSEKSRDTNVYLPYNYEAFSYFYNGNMQRGFTDETDYIVTSVNHIEEVTNCTEVEAAFGQKGFDIVYIYKCN